MNKYDSAIDELVISAENTLDRTDCVTPAFLCEDKKGGKESRILMNNNVSKIKRTMIQNSQSIYSRYLRGEKIG